MNVSIWTSKNKVVTGGRRLLVIHFICMYFLCRLYIKYIESTEPSNSKVVSSICSTMMKIGSVNTLPKEEKAFTNHLSILLILLTSKCLTKNSANSVILRSKEQNCIALCNLWVFLHFLKFFTLFCSF